MRLHPLAVNIARGVFLHGETCPRPEKPCSCEQGALAAQITIAMRSAFNGGVVVGAIVNILAMMLSQALFD